MLMSMLVVCVVFKGGILTSFVIHHAFNLHVSIFIWTLIVLNLFKKHISIFSFSIELSQVAEIPPN